MIFMVLLLPLFTFDMSADEKEAKRIPLNQGVQNCIERSFVSVPIEAYYIGTTPSIQTAVSSDLGTVEVVVANLSTGESWYDIFDSGLSSCHELQISGHHGDYEIIYITESGNMYQGVLML